MQLTFPLLMLAAISLSSCSSEISTDSLARYLKAKDQYETGAFRQSGKEFSNLAKSNPNFHQATFMAGKAAFFQGEVEQAKKIFAELQNREPGHFDAAFWHARCLIHLGSPEKAEDAFLALLSCNSQDPRIFFQLALLKLEQEEIAEALEYLRRAALFGEELAMVFIRLGRLYYRYGLIESALVELKKAKMLLGKEHEMVQPLRRLMEEIRVEAPSVLSE